LVEIENKDIENGSQSHGLFEIDEHEEHVCIKQEECLEIEAEDVKEISHVVYKGNRKVFSCCYCWILFVTI
jgi:hypothetical protein